MPILLGILGSWYDVQRKVAIVQVTQELTQQALAQRIEALEHQIERRR